MACVTIQNMGIYDRCEIDVKNCRPHSLKREEGLLVIDKDFLFVCLSVFILNQRGQNHKDNENAGLWTLSCTWSSSRLRAAMPVVHITFRRLYHTSLIKLHFADYSMYRYCFLLFILHVYVHCHCLRFCAFICYNIIKLISTLDIIAHNFHFYVTFRSPWWKIVISQRNKLP